MKKQNKKAVLNEHLTQITEFRSLTQWISSFREEVMKPIEMRQLIAKRSQNQRCLTHNIATSIYCTICRKVLCASCMYVSGTHRKHRVVPVQNAFEEMREDINTFELKQPKFSAQITGLMTSNNQLLMQLDKKSNIIHTALRDFYKELRELIKHKEEEHIKHLRQFHETARQELVCYNRELSKVSNYISQKFSTYTNQLDRGPHLQAARTILELLLRSSKFIEDSVLDPDLQQLPTELGHIERTKEEVALKIGGLFKKFTQKGFQLDRMALGPKRSLKSPSKRVSVSKEGPGGRVITSNNEMRRPHSSLAGYGPSLKRI